MKKVDFRKITGYFRKGRDWEAIVGIFIVLIIALVLANVYFFWLLQKETAVPVQAETNLLSLRRDLRNQILADLKNKEERFNQNSLIKPDVGDPSL